MGDAPEVPEGTEAFHAAVRTVTRLAPVGAVEREIPEREVEVRSYTRWDPRRPCRGLEPASNLWIARHEESLYVEGEAAQDFWIGGPVRPLQSRPEVAHLLARTLAELFARRCASLARYALRLIESRI